jgi:hypothetical protein
MARMISIHEYDLRPGSDAERFEQAFRAAEARACSSCRVSQPIISREA